MTRIHKSEPWLEQLFFKAKERRWCISPRCTTCACTKFRSAYLTEARRRAGFPASVHGDARMRHPRELLKELGEEGRAATYEALVCAIRELPREATDGDAFRVISIDLDAPLLSWGVVESLPSRLEGTPAGDALSQMVRHSQARAVTQRLRDEYDSPEAAAKRRAEAARQNAERDKARRRKQQDNNQRRLELLQRLTAMSLSDRIAWLAAQPPEFPLDSIPAALIADGLKHTPIAATSAHILAKRIGRRRGAWARIRERLESSC